jgi:hypothetical protein
VVVRCHPTQKARRVGLPGAVAGMEHPHEREDAFRAVEEVRPGVNVQGIWIGRVVGPRRHERVAKENPPTIFAHGPLNRIGKRHGRDGVLDSETRGITGAGAKVSLRGKTRSNSTVAGYDCAAEPHARAEVRMRGVKKDVNMASAALSGTFVAAAAAAAVAVAAVFAKINKISELKLNGLFSFMQVPRSKRCTVFCKGKNK